MMPNGHVQPAAKQTEGSFHFSASATAVSKWMLWRFERDRVSTVKSHYGHSQSSRKAVVASVKSLHMITDNGNRAYEE
jgi:hypothetical protein